MISSRKQHLVEYLGNHGGVFLLKFSRALELQNRKLPNLSSEHGK